MSSNPSASSESLLMTISQWVRILRQLESLDHGQESLPPFHEWGTMRTMSPTTFQHLRGELPHQPVGSPPEPERRELPQTRRRSRSRRRGKRGGRSRSRRRGGQRRTRYSPYTLPRVENSRFAARDFDYVVELQQYVRDTDRRPPTR